MNADGGGMEDGTTTSSSSRCGTEVVRRALQTR